MSNEPQPDAQSTDTPEIKTAQHSAYDELIAPLVDEILRLARLHHVSFFATFALGDQNGSELFATTALPLGQGLCRANLTVEALRRVVQEEYVAVPPTVLFDNEDPSLEPAPEDGGAP